MMEVDKEKLPYTPPGMVEVPNAAAFGLLSAN